MRVQETPQTLERWARAFQRIDDEDIRVDGLVSSVLARGESSHVYLVRGSSGSHYEVAITELLDGTLETRCTCPAGERDLPCKHQSAALRFMGWEFVPESVLSAKAGLS